MKPIEFVKIEFAKYYKIINIPHKIIDSFCLRRMDTLIAISEDVKLAYEERYPVLKGKIKKISGTGVEVDRFVILNKNKIRDEFKLSHDDVIILFAGRLEKIKNLSFLIKSFYCSLKENQNFKLMIVGEGSERPYLEKLVFELDIEDKVIFLGQIDPMDMPKIYNCADITTLTSISEGSPTVLKESLACGTPVVTMNVGDSNKIISENGLGLVVMEFNEICFSNAIIKTLNYINNNSYIRQKCRSVILEKYSFEKIGNEIIEIYKGIL